MREYDKAVGRIASCCSTMGATLQTTWSEQSQRLVINHRGGIFTITAPPADSYFNAYSVRRLSNINGVDLSDGEPIVNVQSDINELMDEFAASNITFEVLTEVTDSDALEYFDGYRAHKPLFVFNDNFGPRTFDESLSELDQTCRRAFNRTVDIVGMDIDEIDEATGDKEEPNEEPRRGFQ